MLMLNKQLVIVIVIDSNQSFSFEVQKLLLFVFLSDLFRSCLNPSSIIIWVTGGAQWRSQVSAEGGSSPLPPPPPLSPG